MKPLGLRDMIPVPFPQLDTRTMQSFQNMMLVGLGGFLGSVSRYLLSGWANHVFKAQAFPVGTAMVNIIGCLIIGFLGGWTEQLQAFSPNTRLFLFLGLLGGFTTFSSFGYETMVLLRDKDLLLALLNVAIHLLLGLGSVFLGFSCSKLLQNQV